MTIRSLLFPVCLSVCLAGAGLSGQTLSEGFRSSSTQLPTNAGNVLSHELGVLYFDGTTLTLDDGQTPRKLLTFQNSVFGSFTVDAGNDRVVFGESSSGDLWLVHLKAKVAPKKIATLKFNYDATLYAPDWLIVSAKTGGFNAKSNDLIAVNVSTGKTDVIAVLPGASGPLVTDNAGNLYYATASGTFPPPKGSVDILRFDRQTVWSAFGSRVLIGKDATTVFSGLDAAGDMALDTDDDLLFVDWVNSEIGELNDLQGRPTKSVLYQFGKTFAPRTVQFQPPAAGSSGNPLASFEAFQDTGAGVLLVHEAFSTQSRLLTVVPHRPATTLSATPTRGKPFSIVVQNGPASGAGLIALSIGHGPRLVERTLTLPGFEQGILWQSELFQPNFMLPVSFDRTGKSALTLVHPGVLFPLQVAAQVGFVDATARTLGSSQPLRFVLP